MDSIQYELGSGPCVDAVLQQAVFHSHDLSRETRWPRFARRGVSETDVRSMRSFRMVFEDGDLLAGLNVLGSTPDAFDDVAETTGLDLSTHAALALTAAVRQARIDQLEHVLANNRDIGATIGILMTRHLATRQQASDMLCVASHHSHRKLATSPAISSTPATSSTPDPTRRVRYPAFSLTGNPPRRQTFSAQRVVGRW